ncbi:ROK family transcriptional regulator [Luethyella okanaganae]|uniref:ROK family protein n=1 Tax=Luethyella okanaganae TaxID=69372 RepID=A0ABW1VAV0_9MICO
MEFLRGRHWQMPPAVSSGQLETRRRNLRAALQLVVENDGRMTRAEIARRSGLTSATVSSLLSELIQNGYVRDGRLAASTGGKPATTLNIDRKRHSILVIVLRPLLLHGAILDLAGDMVVDVVEHLTTRVTPETVAGFAARLMDESNHEVLGVGLQIPGTTNHGRVIESVQLGWHEEPITDLVQAAVGAPCIAINDADAEALAESVSSPDAGRSCLFVHLGEGIGAAIVHDGKLMLGPTGRVGEIGHVRVVYEGSRNVCRCGLTGCLESTSSLSAMLGPAFRDEADLDEIRALAATTDANERLSDGARALARAIRLICATLDIGDVIIGGAAPALGDTFITDITDDLETYPAHGTQAITVRYAQSKNPFQGIGQHALRELLGIRWAAPTVGEDSPTFRETASRETA